MVGQPGKRWILAWWGLDKRKKFGELKGGKGERERG